MNNSSLMKNISFTTFILQSIFRLEKKISFQGLHLMFWSIATLSQETVALFDLVSKV